MEFQLDYQTYLDQGIDYVIGYAPKIIVALLIFWVGIKIINVFLNAIDRLMTTRNIDPTLHPFLHNLLGWTLKIALIIVVIGQIGIETTSFLAVFGAAGLAIGLALQGTLSNFASGVMLLIFRPFKVGNYIIAAGEAGTVEEIGVFVTKLRTPENRLIILPNSAVGSGNITNFSDADKVQVRIAIGISYDSDIRKAREVILNSLQDDTRIMDSEGKDVFVSELADSSVNLSVRFWVDPGDYWPCFFHHIEGVKVALDAAGIEIPFPQRVVTMKQS